MVWYYCPMREGKDMSECFFGTVTVGERGQIVIPVEAREALGIKAGDKLLVMRDPALNALMLSSFSEIRSVIDSLTQALHKANGKEEQ
jgi:AbrB family looped-hinge helix DNA binding protein